MPINSDELDQFDQLVRYGDRVQRYVNNDPDVYIRLRRKPLGERPKVFGHQIWPAKDPNFIMEIVDRIRGSNTSDPVLVELVPKGSGTVLDTVEIPPLLEAMESIISARFDVAKQQGESSVMIALAEQNTRLALGIMKERNEFFRMWKESEIAGLQIRADLLEAQLSMEYSNGSEPEDPEVAKWRELGRAFRETVGPALGPLKGLGALIEQRAKVAAGAPSNGGGAPPVPARVEIDPKPVEIDPKPVAESSGEATPEEIADTTLQWLVEILENAPELLTGERLAKLLPHHAKLKNALGVLEFLSEQGKPLSPEPEPE